MELARAPEPAPSWWTPRTAYVGSIETRTDAKGYNTDGMRRMGRGDQPLVLFQLTLAGRGAFETHRQAARTVEPGMGIFAVAPFRHRYFLPEGSPGWTFAWIGLYHPYLLERIARQVEMSGPVVEVAPTGALAAATLRLLRGAIRKDFRDHLEVELALVEFVIAFQRSTLQAHNSMGEGQRLLDEVRSRVLARLPVAIDVVGLAADYGMSRTHFSHFFRDHTGLTPAHFASMVRVQEAARMLLDTRAPLKRIADACGFANANHFCKVFRRFNHLSPTSYRRGVR